MYTLLSLSASWTPLYLLFRLTSLVPRPIIVFQNYTQSIRTKLLCKNIWSLMSHVCHIFINGKPLILIPITSLDCSKYLELWSFMWWWRPFPKPNLSLLKELQGALKKLQQYWEGDRYELHINGFALYINCVQLKNVGIFFFTMYDQF